MEKLLDHTHTHIEQPISTWIQKDLKRQRKEQLSADRITEGRPTTETHEKETELRHQVAFLPFQSVNCTKKTS